MVGSRGCDKLGAKSVKDYLDGAEDEFAQSAVEEFGFKIGGEITVDTVETLEAVMVHVEALFCADSV
jgi:hypothetical protein